MAKRDFAEVMKETLMTSLASMGPEIKAELSRLGTLGTMEIAKSLFNESTAFTPYGPGQYTPTPELGKNGQDQNNENAIAQPELDRGQGGREM
jgi:hypothetical protein